MDGLIVWALPATMALSLVQAGIMLVDELYYHRRRGLGRFEAFGHPVDTLVFLAALLVPATQAPGSGALVLFAVLALLSTLVITKDEFIHAHSCAPGEQWLHALLFVLHAPVLIGIALVWWHDPATPFLRLLPPAVGAWGAYQIFYWVRHHGDRQQRVLRRAR